MKPYQTRLSVAFDYPVYFTRQLFDPANPLFLDGVGRLGEAERHHLLFYIDSGVAETHPELSRQIEDYCQAHADRLDLLEAPTVVPGGEPVKEDWALIHRIVRTAAEHHLCRHSCIVAVGGGAVLDAVGFAAALIHRGVRHVRVPTTTLAQNDAGVGVKNGMNAHGMKNFVGAFAPPFAVFDDFDFLRTLSQRDWVGGIAEAFKVAAIEDANFFDFLCDKAEALANRCEADMETLIRRAAILHLDHIGRHGDPFEFGNARPLDFGHWAAHKLESLSRYELRHGEAVAIGLGLDSFYAWRRGFISEAELHRLLDGLAASGLPLWHDLLTERRPDGALAILGGLDEFREHLGGQLSVTLPRPIGRKIEVHEMDAALVEESVRFLQARFAGVLR